MSSRLDDLTGHSGPLAAEPPDRAEFNGLKKSGLARLHDAANTTLSLESRFDLAYNAAHALCLASNMMDRWPMPTPGEHKTVQARILTYAEAIGWSIVPRNMAMYGHGCLLSLLSSDG